MPRGEAFSTSDAFAVARQYVEDTNATRRRIVVARVDGGTKITHESLLSFCRRHKYPYRAVWRQYRAFKTTGSPTKLPNGSNEDPKTLSVREETALVAYVTELERAGVQATAGMIKTAGSKILSRRRTHRIPSKWYSDWTQKHPDLRPSTAKPVPLKDIPYDTKVKDIKQWFEKAKDLAAKQEITASTCWSADELGTKEGQIWVVMVRKQVDTPPPPHYRSKDSFSLMGGGNAAGDALRPFCILKNWSETDPVTALYYTTLCERKTIFHRSDEGFSNDSIMYNWICQFNRQTWPKAAEVQRLGSPSLEEWFGYPAYTKFSHMMDGLDPNHLNGDMARGNERPRIWRWLVLGGATGRLSIEIIDYCLRFDIQILTLPVHAKQTMHPIRQGPCQYLKTTDLNKLLNIFRNKTEEDFVSAFQYQMEREFSVGHLMSGFDDSGIWPLKGSRVLDYLRRPRNP
ncbi:hypothetical protein PgNI_11227 [Pyricularia grisea]|uniref:HTH CENPB-type domain-containing protein n=1 Tax=Pyricularia grisea TaxID=148305 RepID=A0A6P8AQ41_PYRGI|nr:hypothetical protein PgNI_11227 [Pyricularia grisea]TLD04145.1 hypothetical protein PgNI_11227 [Pyricularia grisea]